MLSFHLKALFLLQNFVLLLPLSNSKTVTKKKSHFWSFRFSKVLQDLNAIKTLRSQKKRPDELTVLEFIKKDLQTTITYNDINENLVRLTEIGKIKKLTIK